MRVSLGIAKSIRASLPGGGLSRTASTSMGHSTSEQARSLFAEPLVSQHDIPIRRVAMPIPKPGFQHRAKLFALSLLTLGSVLADH